MREEFANPEDAPKEVTITFPASRTKDFAEAVRPLVSNFNEVPVKKEGENVIASLSLPETILTGLQEQFTGDGVVYA